MSQEHGSGDGSLSIGVGLGYAEAGRHHTSFQVEKWDLDQIKWTRRKDYDDLRLIRRGAEPVALDFARLNCKPFETFLEEDCNLITDVGWVNIMGGIAGTTPTKFTTGGAGPGRIGLGVTATTPTYTDSGLASVGALTANNWKPINAVPTVGSTHTAGLILATQFITTDANGAAIVEFAVDYGTAATNVATAVGGTFSRGVPGVGPGTKTSAQTWNATVTYTWT